MTTLNRPVHTSLACFSGWAPPKAMAAAAAGVSEPALGDLSVGHVQLCPQNRGLLTVERAQALAAQYPDTQFRLHANVHVWDVDKVRWDAADVHKPGHDQYFNQLARVSQAINAPAYTLHAGDAIDCDLDRMAANVRSLEDTFGCRVGVEGLYPAQHRPHLLATSDEDRWLLMSGLDYALDVSHLNIVAHHEGRFDVGLLNELLASEHCIELHVSGNDGSRDQHRQLTTTPWWFEPVKRHLHPDCVIFSEGNQHRDPV